MSLLDDLLTLAERIEGLEAQLRAERRSRQRLVAQAVGGGMHQSAVAEASGLTRARVSQLAALHAESSPE